MKTPEDIIFSIGKHTYTEWSRYQQLSYEELETCFNFRYLDYDAHYIDAKSRSFTCSYGTVYPKDILVDLLQDYDDDIRSFFYREKRKGIEPKQIFKNYWEKVKDKPDPMLKYNK